MAGRSTIELHRLKLRRAGKTVALPAELGWRDYLRFQIFDFRFENRKL